MPNGGSDCCANCSHNRALQEMAHPDSENSHCTLRDVKITDPFWTYCDNFDRYPEKRNVVPVGWIYASGLYDKGHVRIPWNDRNEPRLEVLVRCVICGQKTNKGIEVDHDGHSLGFCTNRHYVRWWKKLHQDDTLNSEDF